MTRIAASVAQIIARTAGLEPQLTFRDDGITINYAEMCKIEVRITQRQDDSQVSGWGEPFLTYEVEDA
jgi:hypothetical protein